MRRTLLLALTALLLPAAPTTAASKPKCPPIMTDSTGDEYLPELDIASADVRSDKKVVTVTLTVAGKLGTHTVAGSTEWLVSWVLGAHAYQVRRRDDLRIEDGQYNTYYVLYNGHVSQRFAPSAIKVTASSMQWTIPRPWIEELRKPATKDNRTFVRWRAETSWYGVGIDGASTERTYADLAACWKDPAKK